MKLQQYYAPHKTNCVDSQIQQFLANHHSLIYIKHGVMHLLLSIYTSIYLSMYIYT